MDNMAIRMGNTCNTLYLEIVNNFVSNSASATKASGHVQLVVAR